MGRWPLALLLALAIAGPALAGEPDRPNEQTKEAKQAPNPDEEGDDVSPRRPSPIISPVDRPIAIKGKAADGRQNAKNQDRNMGPEWISAEASRDTARYTLGLLIVGIAGIVVGVATVWAAVSAGRYAKKAATEAGKAAKSAADSYEATIASGRAIVHAVKGYVSETTYGSPTVAINFINKGQSPAHLLAFVAERSDGEVSGKRWTVIASGGEVTVAAIEPPRNKGEAIILPCRIEYRTIGPDVHKSHFTIEVRWDAGDGYGPGEWRVIVSNRDGHPADT